MTGAWGEHVACAFLIQKGYRIIAQNYRTRYGEIDIIAQKGAYLVFVEVKTRKSKRFAEAREFVTAQKQQRLRDTALLWLGENPTELQPRFDVIEVYGQEQSGFRPEIIHLEDAFGG